MKYRKAIRVTTPSVVLGVVTAFQPVQAAMELNGAADHLATKLASKNRGEIATVNGDPV